VVPSRPGYGRTPAASGRTPDAQADLYAAALDTLGIERTAVIGISGGGPSAVAFAQRYPQRTSAMALLCALAPHLIDVPTAMRIGAALPPLAWAVSTIQRRQQRRLLADDAAIDARIAADLTPAERALLPGDPQIRADLVRFLHSHADGPAGLAGLRNDVAAMRAAHERGPQPTDAITAPTLVAHGDADVVVPFAHAEHHARAIAAARLERFADASHIFLLTHRRRTTELLLDHLRAAP
jgi:pimeloyl-ACP methyl ester carboxylesterase